MYKKRINAPIRGHKNTISNGIEGRQNINGVGRAGNASGLLHHQSLTGSEAIPFFIIECPFSPVSVQAAMYSMLSKTQMKQIKGESYLGPFVDDSKLESRKV
jgi:hypothetical protein